MRIPGLFLLAAVLVSAPPVFAQSDIGPAATDPAAETVGQHLGFPIGEKSRIHTYLDLSTGYDSNPSRFPDAKAQGDYKGAIRPGIGIMVPGTLSLDLSGKLSIEHYFGAVAGAVEGSDLGGDVEIGIGAGKQDAPLGFELHDVVARTPTLFNEAGAPGVSERRFKQWSNRGTANLVGRPGGGALELRVGYGNTMSFYDTLSHSQQHGILLESLLKFLPRTAAVFAADMSFFSADDVKTKHGVPYNIWLGLQGQLTARLSTLLRAGFGDSLIFTDGFFSSVEASNIRTLVARASFTYALFERGGITLGYDREIYPVILLNAYTADAGSARIRVGVGSRLNFDLFGEFASRHFADGVSSANLATVDARVEYYFFEWLNAGLAYQLLTQHSNSAANPATALLLENYVRHVVLIDIGLHY